MGDAYNLAELGVREAPASATIRFHLRGYDLMFTLRDTTGRDLLAKLVPVLDALDAMGASPNGYANGNGHGATPEADAGGEPGTKECPIHGVAMKRRTGSDGTAWYSHKLPDGSWCKGKPPVSDEHPQWGHRALDGTWTRGQ